MGWQDVVSYNAAIAACETLGWQHVFLLQGSFLADVAQPRSHVYRVPLTISDISWVLNV